jgi:hypothetical protein
MWAAAAKDRTQPSQDDRMPGIMPVSMERFKLRAEQAVVAGHGHAMVAAG